MLAEIGESQGERVGDDPDDEAQKHMLSRCAKVFRTFLNESIIRNNLVNLVDHYTIPGGPIVPDYSQ